ncbi:MAG: hypothetical protein ABI748_04490, partial [Dokdonella sp.]
VHDLQRQFQDGTTAIVSATVTATLHKAGTIETQQGPDRRRVAQKAVHRLPNGAKHCLRRGTAEKDPCVPQA